jgi:Pex2 / Pex12 amino terminal region
VGFQSSSWCYGGEINNNLTCIERGRRICDFGYVAPHFAVTLSSPKREYFIAWEVWFPAYSSGRSHGSFFFVYPSTVIPSAHVRGDVQRASSYSFFFQSDLHATWLVSRETRLLAELLYYGLTTGAGVQTLGEEYCDILQATGESCGFAKLGYIPIHARSSTSTVQTRIAGVVACSLLCSSARR